ncbi:SUMF1/EgtB/PvdO family nonheme iron enzyme, partial [Gemmatimonadota bacterium]
MAFYSGATLRSLMDDGLMDIADAVDVFIQIASGLAEAHEKDIIHRDIKPANIMLDEKGIPKIVDFGLAKVADVHLTQTGSTLGTVLYMSPEQIRNDPPDRLSDLWSLGVILYEMLTGRLPFSGEHEAAVIASILNDNPIPVANIRPDIPLELEQIVARILHRKQDSRYDGCDEVIHDLKKVLLVFKGGQTRRFTLLSTKKALRKPKVGIPVALGCLLVLFLGFQMLQRLAEVRFAREVLLSRIEDQIDIGAYVSAYRYAQEAEQIIPGDSDLTALWERLSYPLACSTNVPGAEIWIREYTAPESTWIHLGYTPIDSVRLPLGAVACSLVCEGYAPRTTIISWYYLSRPARSLPHYNLSEPVLEGMIYIPSASIPAFLIDRHEVTNGDYLAFVRADGYEDQRFWKEPFIRNGETIPWQEAISTFTESSGNRLGPAGWVGGRCPEGEDDFPVSGISWYEAAAYAVFAGKELPTNAHWVRAALTSVGSMLQPIALASNMSGDGPEPVGSNPGISYFGLSDVAGNLSEWCFNSSGDLRMIRGGSYADAHYMFFQMADLASPFDRSRTTGFRCMKYLSIDDSLRAKLEAPIYTEAETSDGLSWPDPVDDPVYRSYKQFYQYDQHDIDAEMINEESTRIWHRQTVSIPVAYGEDDSMNVIVFMPVGIDPPYKPVVYWPGAEAITTSVGRSSRGTLQTNRFEFLITQGNRAVVYPVLQGTYERNIFESFPQNYYSTEYRDWIVDCMKDLQRTVDYIVSEPALFDTSAITYFGLSWGTAVGPLALDVEPRFKSGIFLSGGFYNREVNDLVNALHYSPHVDVPVLMLTGEMDWSFPYETSQQLMFDLLGSPVVCWRAFPSGHSLGEHWQDIISLSLQWLEDPQALVDDVQGQEGFRVRY